MYVYSVSYTHLDVYKRQVSTDTSTFANEDFIVEELHFGKQVTQSNHGDPDTTVSLPTSQLLAEQKISDKSGEDYKCDVCKEFFCRESDLTTHILTQSHDNNYKCCACNCLLYTSRCV